MRHQTEVGGGVGIAEGRDRGGQEHHTGDSLASGLRELPVGEHLVLALLHDAHVDMQTRSCLAHGDLRSEGNIVAILMP